MNDLHPIERPAKSSCRDDDFQPVGPVVRRAHEGAGFTLIELVIVMAVLLVVMAVAFPSLSNFFRGRHLNSEVNRFLSLSHFAQSRAISEGIPMTVWIDTRNRAYGLSAAAGFTDLDTNAVAYTMHESLEVDFQAPALEQAGLVMNSVGQAAEVSSQLAMIRFQPDGYIAPLSPDYIWFKEGNAQVLWLTRHINGRSYAIQTNQPPALLR